MEKYNLTVSISENLALKALNYWFRRKIFDWKFAIALLLMLLLAAYGFSNDAIIWGSAWGVLTIGSTLYVVEGYIRQRRTLNTMLKRLADGQVEYSLSEEFFSVQAPYGKWELKWDVFKGVLITNEFTLLLYEKGGYSTLPSQFITDDIINFLKDKIRNQGGKIDDARTIDQKVKVYR